ncbi:MAG: hypothetical protein JNK06_07820 [Candidatus Accumulibacter phosphatis]|uniref:hypothetical protein n=1 Tax=Candidatus Accumulibacter phosphatis TaxID=327160 RepID=UPI001A47CC94|nr:hypothetical protein [Candidatus Accumulibacter phosphatis]
MSKLCVVALVVLLTACASVKKVESGNRAVGDRLTVDIAGNWNHLDYPGIKPAQIWTMEGLTVDEFLIYSGVKDGQAMHPGNPVGSQKKDIVFRRSMQIEEVVAMFEGVLTRDGSTFKLLKLEPYPFGGGKGFRFEYERTRKLDNVQQRGLGFGAVDRGELFALVYQAPRLTFFPRHKERVEAIAKSAVIKTLP